MEKSRKGVVVKIGELIDYDGFRALSKNCRYYHIESLGVDSESHCTQKYRKNYVEGHNRCIDCRPENCIVPHILKNSMRKHAELASYMLGIRAIKSAEYSKEAAEAEKIVSAAGQKIFIMVSELGDILEAKFDYSDPDVKKVLRRMK